MINIIAKIGYKDGSQEWQEDFDVQLQPGETEKQHIEAMVNDYNQGLSKNELPRKLIEIIESSENL